MGFYQQKENILDIANDAMFSHAAKDEKHIYSTMSLEERKAWKDTYLSKHKQKYHETVDYIEKLLRPSLGGFSVFSKEGFEKMLQDPNLENKYIDQISTQLFGANLSWKNTYANTLYNSLEDYKLNRAGTTFSDMGAYLSMEGIGAMATYQNRDNFAGMAAFTIGGWFAKSKILNLYLPIEDNSAPELKYKFTLEFAIHPKTKERIPLPAGYRDESLYGTFDLPEVLPLFVDETSTPHLFDSSKTKIEVIDVANSTKDNIKYKEENLPEGFIKREQSCNLLEDSATDDNSISRINALEPTVAISDILYIDHYNADNAVYRVTKVDIENQAAEGVQNTFRFSKVVVFENIKVKKNGAEETVAIHKEKVLGEVDIDSGDFVATSVSLTPGVAPIIQGFKVYALVSDNANQRPGLEHQVERHVYTMKIEYTSFGHIPLTPYTLDNWNLGNETLGYVATMTDMLTKAYSVTRDLKLERHLKRDLEKPISNFPLYNKLGGFYKVIEHNFALTGPVQDMDPYVQSRFALQERVINALATAETYMYIPQDISRQWIFFGPETKIRAFAKLDLYNRSPEANRTPQPINAGGERFGFNLDEAASIIDSLGRNVTFIGMTDIRWLNSDVIGGLKSTNIDYPTFLYYAYLFRIFTGIDPEYRNLSAVLVMGRDASFTMTKAHGKIIITNMSDDLYEKTIAEARIRTIVEKK